MVRQASEKLAQMLGAELQSDSDKIDIFRYALEIILGGLVKLILVALFSYMLGIVDTTIICILSYISIRHFGGGVHLSTYYRCMTVGLSMFLILGKLATVGIEPSLLLIILCFVYALGIYIIFKWVTAKACNKEQLHKIQQAQKSKTLLLLSLWGIVQLFLIRYQLLNYAFASLLGILASLILISPVGYCVMQNLDNLLNKYRKDVAENA